MREVRRSPDAAMTLPRDPGASFGERFGGAMNTASVSAQSACTTTELLHAARLGDRQAWDQLVLRFQPVIYSAIRGYRLQDSDARDVAQATWLRLIEHHWQLREPEALGGWLATTAKRECLRILRDRRRMEPIDTVDQDQRPDLDCDIEQRVVDADTAARARQMMTLLPARSRILLNALFTESPPAYRELARQTGIPMGSIGPTRARALGQLRFLIDTVRPATRPGVLST
jgi:RNA polymerase sigma factor (sigma-70 family)